MDVEAPRLSNHLLRKIAIFHTKTTAVDAEVPRLLNHLLYKIGVSLLLSRFYFRLFVNYLNAFNYTYKTGSAAAFMMLLLSNGYLFFYVRSLNLARIASGVGGQPFT